MDVDLLRSKGIEPQAIQRATVADHRLRIGRRATIVAELGAAVEGLVMSLADEDLERLYGDAGLEDYRPIPVTAVTFDGSVVDAACYVLPAPTSDPPDAAYVDRLRQVAEAAGLTRSYIDAIG
jgi:hypothetical protein